MKNSMKAFAVLSSLVVIFGIMVMVPNYLKGEFAAGTGGTVLIVSGLIFLSMAFSEDKEVKAE